ncbi:hypothetical protein [Duganella sp. BuS-21]|uniref:hypothetical protein n=1 Tax=Duganella sp. BuS-21 TaxID=2943848 RepID=UPI0035A59629
MNYRSEKEGWLFGALGIESGRPYVQLMPDPLERVARKIVAGLAHKTGSRPILARSTVTLDEINGRGEHFDWAPDFSYSSTESSWELWFFDSVRIVVFNN